MTRRGYMAASQSVDWGTPPALYGQIAREFRPTLDVCAAAWNAKCARYFTRDQDGLRQIWDAAVVWCNPPYGSAEIARWLAKAQYELVFGMVQTAVFLLPVRSDTVWFHRYVWDKRKHQTRRRCQMRPLKGRLRFEREDGTHYPAPFPAMVVIFT